MQCISYISLHLLRHQRGLSGIAICAALLSGACGGTSISQPPDMQYGLVECAACRMIVSEPRHASAVVFADGRIERFDDLGCLVGHLAEHPAPSDAQIWVHGADGRWLNAHDAVYRHDPGVTTPMGYGFVAVANSDAIEDESGPLLRWQELPAAAAEVRARMHEPAELGH